MGRVRASQAANLRIALVSTPSPFPAHEQPSAPDEFAWPRSRRWANAGSTGSIYIADLTSRACCDYISLAPSNSDRTSLRALTTRMSKPEDTAASARVFDSLSGLHPSRPAVSRKARARRTGWRLALLVLLFRPPLVRGVLEAVAVMEGRNKAETEATRSEFPQGWRDGASPECAATACAMRCLVSSRDPHSAGPHPLDVDVPNSSVRFLPLTPFSNSLSEDSSVPERRGVP
ncbi:hypothetical protein FB451DRAFT_1401842 [Mycena latifolia]|nr:hypothetical protein FB451DRAFT_1401842 [Mycena latifolia]